MNSHLVCWASLSRELTSRVQALGGEAREAVLQGGPAPCQSVHERRHPHKRVLPPLRTGKLRLHQGRWHSREMAELGPGRGVRDTPVCGLCTRSVASHSKQTTGRSTHKGGRDAAPQTYCPHRDGEVGKAQGGSAGSGWPHPRNKDQPGMSSRATLKEEDE